MVADFRAAKVDQSKVSKAVKQFVENVAKTENNGKRIDSDRESFLLSEYLSGNAHLMNNDEIGYVQGFIFEYQNSRFKQYEEDFVTDNTKKEVSKVAKRMGDKKKIDSDDEAQALALMLKNTRNELNSADLGYIRKLLIDSGYINYLPEFQQPPVNVVNVTINETIIEQEENKNVTEESTKCEEPVKDTYPVKKNVTPPRNKVKPIPPKEDVKPKEKYKVDEAARAQGFGIANKIEEELHDTWTNNDTIKKEFRKVNRDNVYSFVGKMIEITDSHSVFGDSRKRIDYSILKHVTANFLNHALTLELGKTKAWQRLKVEYDAIKRQIEKDPGKTPDEFDIDRLNKAFKALYDEVSKVYR